MKQNIYWKKKNIIHFKLPFRVCLIVCVGLLPPGSLLLFHLIKFDFFGVIFNLTSWFCFLSNFESDINQQHPSENWFKKKKKGLLIEIERDCSILNSFSTKNAVNLLFDFPYHRCLLNLPIQCCRSSPLPESPQRNWKH